MRWFKHMTRANADPALGDLIQECGLEGYGFYWLLLEVVAETMDDHTNRCSLTLTLPQWSHRLHSHHHKVSKYLGKLQVLGRVSVKSTDSKIEVKIPNLLKYRDEYSQRIGTVSGQCPEQDTDIDTERETETTTRKPKSMAPPLVVDLARNLRVRHPEPRQDTLAEVTKKLKALFARVAKAQWEALAQQIDQEHQEACETDQWQRDGGQYAKGLRNWIAANADRWAGKEPMEVQAEASAGELGHPKPGSKLIIR